MILTLDDGSVLDYSAAAGAGATDMALRGLVGAFADQNDSAPLKLRQGVVSAVAADGTISAVFGASARTIDGLHCIGSTVAFVGDTVWAIRNGADMLVLGSQRSNVVPLITSYTTLGTNAVATIGNAAGTIVQTLVVPAVNVHRTLDVSATLFNAAVSAADFWEALATWDSASVATNVFDRFRLPPTTASVSAYLGGLVDQPANTTKTIRIWVRRYSGTAGLATSTTDSTFTNINVTAFVN